MSLDCNLILRKDIKKDFKKLIEELSEKSRLLLEKGSACQNDIGNIKWLTANYFNFKEKNQTFKFELFPNVINTYSYKYEFYDTVDKEIKKCQIYSPFSHLKEYGFEF